MATWASASVLALISAKSSPAQDAGLQIGDCLFDRLALVGTNLVAGLRQGALGGVDQGLALVLGFDQLAPLLILLGVLLGVLDHLLDVVVAQAAGGLDADRLLLVGRLVLGGDVDDAVGVDVEGDLDLRHAARRRGMPTRSNWPSSLLSAAISRSP